MDTRIDPALAVAPPVEAEERDLAQELVCIDVHAETHDVKTFTFASTRGEAFSFKPGQYFLFDIVVDGQIENRCYSISSAPSRSNAISVTVKRVPGGKASNWLHDNLTPGTRINAKGPLGLFIRPSAPKYLFLSGGSGITPVMSMLRELADRCDQTDIVFMHAARTPADLVFRSELSCLAGRMKGLRLHFLPETVVGETQWSGMSGRISSAYMQMAVPDLSARIVMCCGPAAFMAAARQITAGLGLPASNYIEESFDAYAGSVEPAVLAPASQSFNVTFAKQGRTIEVPDGQTVLSCAKKAGVKMPSSCSNGVCGTCKSKLLSGTVDMQHNGGIRQREIDMGLFLPCCSKPLGDLVIDR